ncbi:hypothetical protein MKW92_052575, partial [Papaver armeniacum]
MAENTSLGNTQTTTNTEMLDLASKFRKATLELNAEENMIVLNDKEPDNENSDDRQWDFCLIGKIIIEGRMGYGTVEKNLPFTWNFIPQEEIKIIEVDTNVMIFKLKNKEVVDEIIAKGPWNIDGYLCILFDYFSGLIHQQLDWTKQVYWIQLQKLQPEHMNVKAVEEMGKLLGEVLAIEPPNAIPVDGVPVKVCVNIELTTPLRRGVLAITAAGVTKWVRFYYEKQPKKLCKECFIINHCKGVCEAAADYVKAIHAKPYPFGGTGILKKCTPISARTTIRPQPISRKPAKSTPFVPPQDGLTVRILTDSDNENVQARLGKRQRSNELNYADEVNNTEDPADEQTTDRITLKDKHSGDTARENE